MGQYPVVSRGYRLPAHEIEKVIINTIRNGLIEILTLDRTDDHGKLGYSPRRLIQIPFKVTPTANARQNAL